MPRLAQDQNHRLARGEPAPLVEPQEYVMPRLTWSPRKGDTISRKACSCHAGSAHNPAVAPDRVPRRFVGTTYTVDTMRPLNCLRPEIDYCRISLLSRFGLIGRENSSVCRRHSSRWSKISSSRVWQRAHAQTLG